MSGEAFLDTDVLVYAYDSHHPTKQSRAQEILKSAIDKGNAVLSAQVLGEFFTVVTRKIKDPLSDEEAQEVVESLSILAVQEIDLSLVRRAIEALQRHRISYWDALILAAAEKAGCGEVYSEDLRDGGKYDGVRVVNPFH